nr:MAG TPA: hypothetical protein [Microviridae sp.]
MSTAQYISSYRYAEGDITMPPSYPLFTMAEKSTSYDLSRFV